MEHSGGISAPVHNMDWLMETGHTSIVLILTVCAAFRLHPLVRMHYKAHMTLLNTGLSFQSNCV